MVNFYEKVMTNCYEYFGCHKTKKGFVFRVYAPQAQDVKLVGDFNGWNTDCKSMSKIEKGIWEIEIENASVFDNYKYYIETSKGNKIYKTDPFAFHTGTRPENDGKVYDLSSIKWSDEKYMTDKKNLLEGPINIYEVHLGSWKKQQNGDFLSYRDMAKHLVDYVKKMGYTHIELLPVAEHPYDPSWGYQVTGYYAPTSRYGTPEDFAFFVDSCHKKGIGVILDWVGAHFPKDENGLYEFDGSCLYEYADPLKQEHPEWNTRIFDFGKKEVVSFLVSNINFWQKIYHIDGFRVDAVASMLYLDYGKKQGEWRANEDGGNINNDAVKFLQILCKNAFIADKNVLMIAEESTAFPLVTMPPEHGGLGFNLKWNMGWMNDILNYFSTDPLFRKGNHRAITFSMFYAFSENFVLPLSHDEVVYGKKSLIDKIPGSYDEKFDTVRAFYAYMFAHPGKKLNFMGCEFAQFSEWDFSKELDWFLLSYEKHKKMHVYMKELNDFYLKNPELWEIDFDWQGFRWIICDDNENSVIAFMRMDKKGNKLICVSNFCPVQRENYRIGVPENGTYKQVFSSDKIKYGGKSTRLLSYKSKKVSSHGMQHSLSLTLKPLSTVYLKIMK